VGQYPAPEEDRLSRGNGKLVFILVHPDDNTTPQAIPSLHPIMPGPLIHSFDDDLEVVVIAYPAEKSRFRGHRPPKPQRLIFRAFNRPFGGHDDRISFGGACIVPTYQGKHGLAGFQESVHKGRGDGGASGTFIR